MKHELQEVLAKLGIVGPLQAVGGYLAGEGPPLAVRSPIDGSSLAELPTASIEQVHATIEAASRAFPIWRDTPAPGGANWSAASAVHFANMNRISPRSSPWK